MSHQGRVRDFVKATLLYRFCSENPDFYTPPESNRCCSMPVIVMQYIKTESPLHSGAGRRYNRVQIATKQYEDRYFSKKIHYVIIIHENSFGRKNVGESINSILLLGIRS